MEVTWEKMYDELTLYIKNNNTLRINRNYVTKDNINLHNWLCKELCNYKDGKLSNEHKNLLGELGYINLTKGNYYRLSKFIEHYKHQNVPSEFRTLDGIHPNSNGVDLGAYIRQINCKFINNKLSQDLYIKLKAIGYKFELDDEKIFKIFSQYKSINGSIDIPEDFETNDLKTYSKDGMYKLSKYKYYVTKKIVNNQMYTNNKVNFILLGLRIPGILEKIDNNDIRRLHKMYLDNKIKDIITIYDIDKEIQLNIVKEFDKLKTKRQKEYDEHWFRVYYESKRLLDYYGHLDFEKISKNQYLNKIEEDVIIDDFVRDKSYFKGADLYEIKSFLEEAKELYDGDKLPRIKRDLIDTIYNELTMTKKDKLH